ncbi:MAG: bifunctional riboflavin kinase/FAD synthetase [Chitinophagaceae bacterium]|nr:bifunctional riboflavin kinase/FAD synthetase [Chitinophagaceae bacterium]
MQVHSLSQPLPAFRNAVVTIGTFDGVHRGHRLILDRMRSVAEEVGGETVIITFDPHPRNIVGMRSDPQPLLTTMPERINLLAKIGIDHLVIVPFSPAFAAMDPRDYVQDFLVARFHPHTLIIGYDHRFGRQREGDYHLLESLSETYGFQVRELDAQILRDAAISSTRIREALTEGRPEEATEQLGYPYFFSGLVRHGDKRGRTIGFPTANLKPDDPAKLLPADGVYAVRISLSEADGDAYTKTGMMNIGLRPTVDGTRHLAEVNIFDFNEDIYGRVLTVQVISRIREERKFSGLEALQAQLSSDRSTAMLLTSTNT